MAFKQLTIRGALVVSGAYVILAETVSHGGEDLAQKLLRDEAGVLLVEAAEGVLDDLLWVGALQPLAEQRQEHGEVERAGRLAHHSLQVFVGRILACNENRLRQSPYHGDM